MLDRRNGLSGAGVVEDEVAVRERTALGVLSRETDRDTVLEEAREGEALGLAPVDPSLVDGLPAPLELALELRMDDEPLRHGEELLVQHAQPLVGHGGLHRLAGARRRGRLR